MKSNRSEIFEEYAKIAEDQGLLQKESYFNTEEYRKKIEDADGRSGSDDISTIEALYGKPKEKGEKSYVEQAHPETVVIAPAYDRFNGVVENIQERHNIMVDIALKPAHGNPTVRRYVHAKQDLLDSLIRIGFLMDSKNEEPLVTLADSCAARITENEIIKTAFEWGDIWGPLLGALSGAGTGALIGSKGGLWGAVIGAGIGGAVGLFGAIAITNHVSPADQGVINNAQNAIDRLQEALEDAPNAANVINNLIKQLQQFVPVAIAVEHAPIVNLDFQDVIKSANNLTDEEKKNLEKSASYAKLCEILQRSIAYTISTLKQVKPEESNLPRGIDYIGKGMRGVVGTQVKDAILALETLGDSVKKSSNDINQKVATIKAAIQSAQEQQATGITEQPAGTTEHPAAQPSEYDEALGMMQG